MNYRAINFRQKAGLFTECWQPKVVAEMNVAALKPAAQGRVRSGMANGSGRNPSTPACSA